MIVSAHVYSGDGKLLMARNAEPDTGVVYGNLWKIPGGGVEEGETHEETLAREVREEVGIDIAPHHIERLEPVLHGEAEKSLRDTGERVLAKMTFITYKVVLDKPASEISITLDPHEFTEYRWFDLDELGSVELSPASVELFTVLGLLP